MLGRNATAIVDAAPELGSAPSPKKATELVPPGGGGEPGQVPTDVGARVEAAAIAELGEAVSVLHVAPYVGGLPVFEVQAERPDGERVTLYVDESLAIIGLDAR